MNGLIEARYLVAVLKDNWVEQAVWLLADGGDDLEDYRIPGGYQVRRDGVPIVISDRLRDGDTVEMLVGGSKFSWQGGSSSSSMLEMVDMIAEWQR